MPVSRRLFWSLSAIPVLLCALVFSGCDRLPKGLEPDKIVSMTPETQLGFPGETIAKKVRVELLSNVVPGMLGGKGEPHPMRGVQVQDPRSSICTKDANEWSGQAFDQINIAPDLAGARGNLAADKSGPDHDQPLARADRVSDLLCILDGPEDMNT